MFGRAESTPGIGRQLHFCLSVSTRGPFAENSFLQAVIMVIAIRKARAQNIVTRNLAKSFISKRFMIYE